MMLLFHCVFLKAKFYFGVLKMGLSQWFFVRIDLVEVFDLGDLWSLLRENLVSDSQGNVP